MSAQINLPVLPGWAALTDSERHHAGRLGRMLQDSGMVAEWRPGCANQVHFRGLNDEKREGYIERYAQDSLLCALTHQEKIVAFRALLQAMDFIATLRELKRSTGYLNDAKVVAQQRVERWLETDGG